MAVPAEVLNPRVRRGPFRAVLFDFDGTLSLIREGWPQIMVGMMVEWLREHRLAEEPDEELWRHVDGFVMALNGHPTLLQMARFAEDVRQRGGTPAAPAEYLRQYLDRLMRIVRQRWHALEAGRAAPDAWVVPEAHGVLEHLAQRGVPLVLASGTDLPSVRYEGALLNVLAPFGPHIYAPDGDDGFSKGRVVDRMLAEFGIRGEELLGFGDGVVEAQEVKRVGGTMVGIASRDAGQRGVNAEKRDRLAAAGADLIVADYSPPAELIAWLFAE